MVKALFFAVVVGCAAGLLDVGFDNATAGFTISISGSRWLKSGPIRAYAGGAWQGLVRTGTSTSSRGTDSLGAFDCVNVSWVLPTGGGAHPVVLHTALKTYAARDAAVFVQQLPRGATRTDASRLNMSLATAIRAMDPGNYPPIVSFPSFTGGRLQSLRYLTWQSRMVSAEYGRNVTSGSAAGNEPLITGRGLQGLSTSGPVVLFDAHDADAGFASLVVSPLDNFKSAVHYMRRSGAHDSGGAVWEAGVTSELTSLPAGFEHRTLLVAGTGVTATLQRWGRAVLAAHGTDRSLVQLDRNVQYLSYWTDNGAYLSGGAWGEAGGGGDPVNETAFRAVAAGLERQRLWGAVRTWQLDDWWYHGRASVYSDCVNDWSLPAATFPSGLRNLSAALGTPWLLYVPFWCPENTHNESFRWIHSLNPNGTHPELVFAEPHPDDALAFYRFLFRYGAANGMAGYEQDYLDYNYLNMPYLRRTGGAAHAWLAGMDTAALEREPRVPVQMCMALPSDLMASVQLHSVTNYRCSTDYGIDDSSMPLQPHDDNLNIGSSSLLGWALGLRPSKDIFWTSRPPNCRGADPSADPHACGRWGAHTNPGSNCELNALVATLSTGPVSLADKPGATNATIVRRCVRQDGRILQPDKPATTVDSLLALEQAPVPATPAMISAASTVLAPGAPAPALAAAAAGSSSTGGGARPFTWHYVLSVDAVAPGGYALSANDLFPRPAAGDTFVAHQWFARSGHAATACVNGTRALASGCIAAVVPSAGRVPALRNTRPLMVANDTHVFDLLVLAPVAPNGWALLGEVGAYVRVSRDRFDAVAFPVAGGVRAEISGSEGETVALTALQPAAGAPGSGGSGGVAEYSADWQVLERSVTFGASGRAAVTFGNA
eukprot:g1458.t1